ncbi:MAG TPA: carbon monoxide dehydrogenase subunit G [Nitrososphaerales archaeon]|nr:carbon monoxide dehydrogenase subunit G [Nitrososphaerales archaeon]
MHFEGFFAVSAPRERVFGVISDPNQVARCIPDLRRLDVKSAEEFDAVVGVGVAIIRGELSMRFRTVEKDPPSRFKLLAHGTGLGSAVDLEMVTELADAEGGGTSMKWTADATVSGKIASLGQGLMKSQSEKIIRQLFDCLRGKLE